MRLFQPDSARQLHPLRGRQIPLIPQIAEAVREGHKRIVVQAPTGFGKTVVAAHLMERSAKRGKRPMFVAPAIALIEQTLASFEAQGLQDIGIIQAQHRRTDWKAQIQIASRDTLIRRKLPEVDFVNIDEVHDQRDALNEIIDGAEWRDKIIIAFSATPWSKGLGLHWTKLIIAATMADMIADGPPAGLSPFRVFSAPHDPDMSKVKVVGGEFQEAGAAAAMSDKKIVGDVVDTWLKHREAGDHPGDRTFLYGVNRAHARSLMEAFQAKGVPFGYMDGTSTPEERLRTFAAYRSREIKGIASVGVLLTGVDEDVRVIDDCAPTRSEITHVQKAGRGARLAEGKTHTCLLDHAGNCLRLGLPWDIHHDTLDMRLPKDKEEAYAGDKPTPKPRKCRKCFAIIPPKTHACPKCGDVYVAPNVVKHERGELVEFTQSKPKKPKRDEKQTFYSGLLGYAQERGFSHGWAFHKYQSRFAAKPTGLKEVSSRPTKEVRDFAHKEYVKYKAEQATKKKAEAMA